MKDHSIGILVPAYNAGRTLPLLLEKLCEHVRRDCVLVVDDGSTDGSARLLQELRVAHIRHEQNLGKGAALRTGFGWFRASGAYDAVVTIDADLQHRPEDLPRFIECWKRGGPDLVLGSRTRRGSLMPLPRVVSNTVTSALVSARCGVAVSDSQCGYRLLSREVVERVRFDSDGYEAETEFLVRALLMGFRAQNVHIQTVYGDEKSHMTPWHTTKKFVSVLFRDY